jgi:ketopantoate reductase
MNETRKNTVLVIGAGSVGAIAALNLKVGGLASVTVALRSNYNAVKEQGYTIDSCDHGSLKGFRPSAGSFRAFC